MMKRSLLPWGALVIVAFIASSAGLAQDVGPKPPVLVTSIGQSADVLTAGVLAQRAGLHHVVEPLATPKHLDGMNTVIFSVGVSLKGFGAAGISRRSEEERARVLLSHAKDKGTYVIVLLIGGSEDQDGGVGALTMHFVELIAPEADMLIISEDANSGYFTNLSEEKGIPVIEIRQVLDLPGVYKDVFGI